MQMKTLLPVEELRQLLAAVSDHGTQHLQEVEADLLQTNFLLSEAIKKLSTSFMQIHSMVMLQQEQIDSLLARHEIDGKESGAAAAYREQIGDEVNAVVTGMQFQDLTSQLITRSVRRVNGLRDLLAALATHGDVICSDSEHEDIARLLDEMHNSLRKRSVALEGGLRQSVNQQHMGSGEIELF